MGSENINAASNEVRQGDVILEMMVDENEKNKYKLILPMSYGVEFSEVDGKGKNISTSSLTLTGAQTVIRTPEQPSKWKLTVKNLSDRSSTDPTGVPVAVDPDGSGDWLMVKTKDMDENSRQIIQSVSQAAMRTIIFQQQETIEDTQKKAMT